jgi:geranylgeranyl diphosphate synthase, type I
MSIETSYRALDAEIKRRGKETIRQFRISAISRIQNPDLLRILQRVNKYWKDYLRPALTTLSCEAVGGQPEKTKDLNLMLSLTFAGIGIHDDIIDETPNKHFRMTTLYTSNAEKALLTGDLLIMKGWATLNDMIQKADNPSEIAEFIKVYDKCALELCEAEMTERTFVRNLEPELKTYEKMQMKAAADIETSVRLGAMAGNGKKKEIEALSNFGRRLGYISRLRSDVEDVLNVEGNLKHRLWFESVPLPLLYASKSSKENYSVIEAALKKPLNEPPMIKKMLETCFETKAFNYVETIAQTNEKQATKQLMRIKSSAARDTLRQIIERESSKISSLCL